MVGVTAALAMGFGLWQWGSGRRRYGLMAMAGTIGPVGLGAGLFADALLCRLRGRASEAKRSALGALAAGAACVVALAVLAAARWSPGAWWACAVALETGAVIAVFYAPAADVLGARRLAGLLALRCAAVLTLLAVLFKPALAATAVEDWAKPVLPVLLDRSGSMGAVDRAGQANRHQLALAALGNQADRLARYFRVSWLAFAEGVQAADDVKGLARLGTAGAGTNGTDIALALREAVARAGTAPCPGVLLVSDGIHNGRDDAGRAAADSPLPVYVAAAGSSDHAAAAGANVQLLGAGTDWTATLNNVAKVSVKVHLSALAGQTVKLELHEEGLEAPLAQAEVKADQNNQTISHEFSWTPRERPGQPAAGADLRKLVLTATPAPGERTLEDNRWETHVLVTQPRIRVLYVEGTIRPEYAPLKRCLDSDPNVLFAGLVRFSESNFQLQGRMEGRPLAGLPATSEEFSRFDAIILGDMDSSFWTRGSAGRLENLKRWVDAGGGLLMIGGQHTFAPGGYDKSPLAEVMPVEMSVAGEAQERAPFVPKLTAAGRAHPIFEGIGGYFPGPGDVATNPALRALEPLSGCVRVARAKPGADTLAVHPTRANDTGPLVVLATARYGQGRTAAFTADTTWVWDMPLRDLGAESPYQRFWGQMVRWLANVSAKRRAGAAAAVLRTNLACARAQDDVSISALVQDRQGQPAKVGGGQGKGLTVRCRVARADGTGEKQTLDLDATGEPGVFAGKWSSAREGAWRLELSAADEAGPLGLDSLPLFVAGPLPEMDNLARDDRTLRRLAEAKGGRLAELSDLEGLVTALIERGKQVAAPPDASRGIHRLYHFPSLFLGFVALITAEWLLRRRWQLR
ncbi:MAG: glutamine amidotransferase [Planctomycetota bacterium]|nr:glutamine amidotransferase [Planctomycetota bacterium]